MSPGKLNTFREEISFHPALHVNVQNDSGARATWRVAHGAQGDVALLAPPEIYTALGMLFGGGKLSGWLRQNQVELSAARLALLDDRVYIVIGTQTPSLRRPQIWVDQETFLPRRLIFSGQAGWVDIDLAQWSGPITRGRFPHRIELRLNRRPLRTWTARSISPWSVAKTGGKP